MNYFTFYNIPVSFNPDVSAIKQQYYALSKKYHPDFYINEPPEKQEEVLQLSTVNNEAYKVLSDPQLRIQHILQLHDLLPEGENYPLPQSFLMEMMDVNEQVMELEFEEDANALVEAEKQVKQIAADLRDEEAMHTAGFETLPAEEQKARLLKVKDVYYRKKYLSRLEESVARLKKK